MRKLKWKGLWNGGQRQVSVLVRPFFVAITKIGGEDTPLVSQLWRLTSPGSMHQHLPRVYWYSNTTAWKASHGQSSFLLRVTLIITLVNY